MRTLFVLLAILFCGSVQAAEITATRTKDMLLVKIVGSIELGDQSKFSSVVGDSRLAIVDLDSRGGNVFAALKIGELMQARHYQSSVLNGRVCASACGIIWVAGSVRIMGDRTTIGFHSAFETENGTVSESSGSNAVVGAYYNRLGLTSDAIYYMTKAPPEGMMWMDAVTARSFGINVVVMPSTNVAPEPAVSALSDSEIVISNRLARLFTKQYDTVGAKGINVSIAACYRRSMVNLDPDASLYCAALDALAYSVDKTLPANRWMIEAGQYNASDKTRARIALMAWAAGMEDKSFREKAAQIALAAQNTITGVGASDYVASNIAPTVDRSDALAHNARCSQEADRRGLSGIDRWQFRAACKAN